ncbi:T9SS type A sorting domain-containing protein [Flavobacterium sp. N1994]|uniref:T9SS type A sorting domain-containing protein n=1 Tax=Flavobacterium sp. N1994 TaxID=2986827 RepID=UPI0022223CBF|nr:T9SS type A sorting domain-containing protein [Flavobacterium sp. N1994]
MLFLFIDSSASAATYYLDSVAGIDSNNGTSISTPWKNITKLNTMTLQPNDKVYLKCGSVWYGQQLKFSGSGLATFPIVIDQYGTGAKPILNGSGPTRTNGITTADQGVVYLYNQDYIEINNLEITNYPLTTESTANPNSIFFIGISGVNNNGVTVNNNPLGADRRGVMIAIKDKVLTTSNTAVCSHIYLKNLYIHNIKGQLGNGEVAVNGAIPKRTGGIYFAVLNENSASNSRFNDVLIDGCEVAYSENIGLAFDNEDNVYYPGGTELAQWTSRKFTNIKVSNNSIHHIGKNAMIIRCTDETGLVERNVCYETALGTTGNTMFTARAKGTVFQYNEGYYNRAKTQQVDPGNIDGSMYDPDFGSVGIIFQYSYSHDNSHGIYWGCNARGSNNNNTGIPDPEDVGCTLRYCISQNDRGSIVYFNYASAGNEIYNNVFYIKSGISPSIIKENSGNNHTYNFFNNIIYNMSSTGSGASYDFGTTGQVRNFKNNIFYGNHPSGEPQDSAKLISDPLFLNPGAGGIGINAALDGYKLNPNSPAISSGRLITTNGGFDFYGATISTSAVPNRGVYEGTGVLDNEAWSQNTMSIYPNPFYNNQFNIAINDDLIGKLEIEIFNMLGQLLYKEVDNVVENTIIVKPDVILEKGMYIVTLRSQNKYYTFKITSK